MVYAARKVRLKRRAVKAYNASVVEPVAEREYTMDYGARRTRLKRVDADGVAYFPLNTGMETAV